MANLLKKILTIVVQKFACYYDGEYFAIEAVNDKQSLSLGSKLEKPKLIVIVARKYYSETAKQYPVTNRKDLKKILGLEKSNTHGFYRISKIEESSSVVNWWQFDGAITGSFLTVPESFLIAKLNGSGVINTVGGANNTLFVMEHEESVFSAYRSTLINNVGNFANSVGAKPSDSQSVVPEELRMEFFRRALKKVSINEYIGFVTLPNRDAIFRLLAVNTGLILFVYAFYLLSTIAYFEYKERTLNNKLDSYGPQIGQVLDEQQKVDANIELLNSYSNLFENANTKSPLWLSLRSFFHEVEFSNIRYTNGRYVLRGRADKATDLLQNISELPFISDAKFDFATRKSRDKEVFVISFIADYGSGKQVATKNLSSNKPAEGE